MPGPDLLQDQRPPVSRDSSGRHRPSQEIDKMKTHNAGKLPATAQPPADQPGAAARLPLPSTLDLHPPSVLEHQTLNRLSDDLLASDSDRSGKGLPHDHGTLSPSLLDSPRLQPTSLRGLRPGTAPWLATGMRQTRRPARRQGASSKTLPAARPGPRASKRSGPSTLVRPRPRAALPAATLLATAAGEA